MPNYLSRLQHFYRGDGTGNLIDAVGGTNILEVGTVGENVADGPPPEPGGSSRGPCSQGNVGFRRTAAPWGYLDPRVSSGVLPRTMAAWWRLDSLSGDQNVMNAMAQSSPALFHWIGRYELAFETWVVHLDGGTSVVDAGAVFEPVPDDAKVVTGAWNFSGWSYDGAGNVYVHHNGFTRHASSTFLGFTRASLVNVQFGLEFLTTEPGLLGDIAYVMVFDLGFRPQDWSRFWRGGAGLKFPEKFRWEDAPLHVIAAQISKARGSVR